MIAIGLEFESFFGRRSLRWPPHLWDGICAMSFPLKVILRRLEVICDVAITVAEMGSLGFGIMLISV